MQTRPLYFQPKFCPLRAFFSQKSIQVFSYFQNPNNLAKIFSHKKLSRRRFIESCPTQPVPNPHSGAIFQISKKSFRVRVCNVEAIFLSTRNSINGVSRATESFRSFHCLQKLISIKLISNNQLENCFSLQLS